MAMLTQEDLRLTDRKRVLKGAKISYAARCVSLPCVVRDISSTGARLQVKDHGSAPETFELLIELDGFEVEVEVVWRKKGEIGVIFLDEPIITNPKRRQVISSSVPKARGTLRRVKSVSGRRDVAPNTDVAADVQISSAETTPVPTDVGLDADTQAFTDVTTADAQVEALTASLQTMEIVANEDVSVTNNATIASVLPIADDRHDAEADVLEDSLIAAEEIALDVASGDLVQPTPTVATDPSIENSNLDDDHCAAVRESTSSKQHAPLEVETVVASEAAQAQAPCLHDETTPDVDDTSDATPIHSNEQQDSAIMDQTLAPLVSGDMTDSDDDARPSPTSEAIQQFQVSASSLAWEDNATRDEAPMFRDQFEETATALTTPEMNGERSAELDVAQDAVAPIMADVATATPVAVPLQSRIETALQAPTRAADNLVQPLTPIVPAPTVDALTAKLPDADPQVSEPAVAMIAPMSELGSLVNEAATDVADVALETAVTEPVDADVDVSEQMENLASAPVDAAPMRPELAAFVSMFASPQVNSSASSAADTDTVAATSTSVESDVPPPAEDVSVDTQMEAPTTSPAPGAPRLDNVLAFVTAQAETSEKPQFNTASEMAIAEDAIIIDDTASEAPMPTFCEMQVALPREVETPTTEADPTSFEELLPCADADQYVAPVVTEADVLQVTEAAMPSDATTATHIEADTPMDVCAPLADVVAEDLVAEAPSPVPVPMPAMQEEPEAPAVTPAKAQNIPILIAEDDADDRLFMREAFNDSEYNHDIAFVENGEELLAYLNAEGAYADSPRPGLILLDLNMPKMDGRTALLHIKSNPSLRRIPVIVLTTSNSEDDIEKTYDLGVSSYISKPSSAEGLKEIITTMNGYWSNLVALPTRH